VVTNQEVLPGCARVRTKCAENTSVGLWCQSRDHRDRASRANRPGQGVVGVLDAPTATIALEGTMQLRPPWWHLSSGITGLRHTRWQRLLRIRGLDSKSDRILLIYAFWHDGDLVYHAPFLSLLRHVGGDANEFVGSLLVLHLVR
jgi:hypothetical protein